MKNYLNYILLTVVAMVCSCSSDSPGNIEPRLLTLPATGISRTEATLSGKCSVADGVDMPRLWFSYGSDESMSKRLDVVDAPDGNVSLHLSGLTAGTTYHYMLRGTNGTATLSGQMLSFATLPNNRPTVSKVQVLSSGPMSLIVGYSIVDDGGDRIMASGCRIVRSDGTDSDEKTFVQTEDVPDEKGMMRLRIDGLQPDVTYTIKPFAANRNGEAVGEALQHTTSWAIVLGEAGILATLIGNDANKYTNISLAGPLNGDDLCMLRRMAGRDTEGNPTDGQLADIDISGANIVAGGGEYGESRFTEDGVVGIGLFRSCTILKNIKLPIGAVRIDKEAFNGCTALQSITIPASVGKIVPSAGCTSLASIEVSAANEHYTSVDGVLMSSDCRSIIWFPMGKKGEYTLPSTVEAVGDYAFRDCNIEKFVFADGLTKIGQCAFYNSKVREVVLPSTLKQLPSGLFQKCAHLTTVHLGKDIELLPEYVFDGCPLSDIYVNAPIPPVCYKNTFATTGTDFTKTCRVHVPRGSKAYYRSSKQWAVFENIVDDIL